jgi:hypothetical protein
MDRTIQAQRRARTDKSARARWLRVRCTWPAQWRQTRKQRFQRLICSQLYTLWGADTPQHKELALLAC